MEKSINDAYTWIGTNKVMSDIDLNEDIHQYPIRSKFEVGIAKTEHQISQRDITVVFPIHNPQVDDMNNLRFILGQLLKFKVKVIVVEQTKDQYSYLLKFLENILIAKRSSSKYLSLELYVSQEDKFMKEEAINWTLKNKVKTKYALINDPNFYQDFNSIFQKVCEIYEPKFVSTYSFVKNLEKDVTGNFISTKNFSIEDIQASYSKVFAHSILLRRKDCFEIGGLVEGDSDYSVLLSKAHDSGKKVDIVDETGIYLYNGPKISILPRMEFESTKFERDMPIIICHFNWCKYMNPARNLNRFLRQMDVEGYPVYGIELSLDDKFETAGRKNWIHMRVEQQNICFQKEACINLVEKTIPEHYQKIAWIDPDLYFTNQNWYRETSEKLNNYKLVQMYSEGYGTDRYGRISRRHPSIMSMYNMVPMDYWLKHTGHPGGAWGAKRDFFRNGGLYPFCIMGGGDTVFVYTLFGHTFSNDIYKSLGLTGHRLFAPYVEWRSKITSYITGPDDITYVNNAFIHEWHGERVKRNYNFRHTLLKNINIHNNVRLNDAGLVELYDIKFRSTFDNILGYFQERDEDGVIGDMEDYIDFRNKKNAQQI